MFETKDQGFFLVQSVAGVHAPLLINVQNNSQGEIQWQQGHFWRMMGTTRQGEIVALLGLPQLFSTQLILSILNQQR